MQDRHLPSLGPRFWAALCLASIFGANMGDYFAHNLGLGHVAGLPFLAVAFALVLVVERFDRAVHEVYYWVAIILVRTAATNLGDFFAGDLKLPRPWVMAGLIVLLAIVVAIASRTVWRTVSAEVRVLRADAAYWLAMLVAGTLGTVMGDYVSHNLHLGDLWGSVALSVPLLVLFAIGSRGLIRWLPFYWVTVVMVRAAGTLVGDYFAGRKMLGLPLSTLVTGVVFVGLLVVWRERRVATATTGR